MRSYAVTGTPVLLPCPLLECYFRLPDFQLAIFGFLCFLIRPKEFLNSVTSLAINDLTLPDVLWPVWLPNERSIPFLFFPSFYFFVNCSPDYYPSSPARFKRSKTVKVQKFPLFKNLNKTLVFRHGHIATTAGTFWPPQSAESHPFKTSPFLSTLPYHRPFNFTCPMHPLLAHVHGYKPKHGKHR